MNDATPSATLVPEPPVAAVTNPEAPFPPVDPLPHATPPAIADPVSNLEFLPVDDAFALEMRSETIEQLVGGDALRRGESERIEAGRSHTNADLVAGHDRVRVHATLHEHTGHGLAEQAAHLHTTVDGTLDVHAGNEDTVLLAGHMRDLWDGGAAIVAAMTDDTVAGGGIRVTAPLDIWVHGLMGVEERIGTCTADAVLLELGATHYEREYGPGVHAAGLAVYTGSLYQSSRSTFRPLMRVSSGVRNLIAGGGGGGGGGGGVEGGAPCASPPPVPAETGAAAQSASATLAAGRGIVEAPATTLDSADALTDARRVPLEALVNSVDARTAEEMGKAGTVTRAENLPELIRCAGTAEQLGALQETLRIDGAASGSETTRGYRASEFEDAVSMHSASDGGRAPEITPPPGVYGENARMARPHPRVPWGQGPQMKLGLAGGADRPPQSAVPKPDFLVAIRRMRDLRVHYHRRSSMDITRSFYAAVQRADRSVKDQLGRFGGQISNLGNSSVGVTNADKAYLALQEMARQADRNSNSARAVAIRAALDALGETAVEELQALCANHGIAEAPSTRAMQRPPVTAGPTETVAAIPPPAHVPVQFDWVASYRQLRGLARHFSKIGQSAAAVDIRAAIDRMVHVLMRRFRRLSDNPKRLFPLPSGVTKAEQAYSALEDMFRRARESDDAARADRIGRALETIRQSATRELDELTTLHGALDALFARLSQARTRETMQAMQAIHAIHASQAAPLLLARVGPTPTVALPVTVMPPVTGGATQVPVSTVGPGSVGRLVQIPGVPGPPPASSLPGPFFPEAAGAQAGDLGRWWLHQPAIAPGATAAQPAATGNFVTPALGGTSSFWLQPVDPVRAPVTVPFDSGPHHAGESTQPPPVTTAPSSIAHALSPGAAFLTPSWLDIDFPVERALLADMLPPEFDASRLIHQARTFAEFGLADELAARRLPLRTIDVLMDGYRANDEGSRDAQRIESLRSLKESIERALHAAYPGRVEPEWLDLVRALEPPHRRGEPASPSAASATALPELGRTDIARLLGTGEGVLHPAPLPPPSAPGRTGAGAGAPPPAADPRGIRPPGMSGEPHPVAFDPWSAPPGPGSRVVYTEAMRTPVLSTGAPPGWPGAGTPGFARAASGAVELPFRRREEIAIRFGTEDALLEADVALRAGAADALGWSASQRLAVRNDIDRLHDAIVRWNPAGAAALVDIDWNAMETLMLILDVPHRSP